MKRERRPNYSPTQYDIKKACERIRENWSEREFKKRSGELNHDYVIPRIDLSNFVDIIRESRRRDYE